MSTELILVGGLAHGTNHNMVNSHQISPTGVSVLRIHQNEMLKTLINTAFHFSHVRSYPCESDELSKVFVIGVLRFVLSDLHSPKSSIDFTSVKSPPVFEKDAVDPSLPLAEAQARTKSHNGHRSIFSAVVETKLSKWRQKRRQREKWKWIQKLALQEKGSRGRKKT